MINRIEQIESKQKEIARNQTAYTPNFKAYLDNIPIPSLTTTLGNCFRTDTLNWTDLTIQPTIVHVNQATGLVQNDCNISPHWEFE